MGMSSLRGGLCYLFFILFMVPYYALVQGQSFCEDNCLTQLQEVFTSSSACERFQFASPLLLVEKNCKRGYEVGVTIGCLHRCSTAPSQWHADHAGILKAKLHICKQDTVTKQACDYGFHFALWQIFTMGFTTTSSNAVTVTAAEITTSSESYIVFPLEMGNATVSYAYMEEKEDPEVAASRFCAKHALSVDKEIECIFVVKLGLETRLERKQWQHVFPRIDSCKTILWEGKMLQIVSFQGETLQQTARAFCLQMGGGNGSLILVDKSLSFENSCMETVIPRLSPTAVLTLDSTS